jgi:hypothetical protein
MLVRVDLARRTDRPLLGKFRSNNGCTKGRVRSHGRARSAVLQRRRSVSPVTHWAPRFLGVLAPALLGCAGAEPKAPGHVFAQTEPGCSMCGAAPDGGHALVLINVDERLPYTVHCLWGPKGVRSQRSAESLCAAPPPKSTEWDW